MTNKYSARSAKQQISIQACFNLQPDSGTDAYHEAGAGGGAAAHIEGDQVLGTGDLIVTGGAFYLFGAVQQHAHASGTHRISQADQSTAGINWEIAACGDTAFLHGFPAFAGGSKTAVIYSHIFGDTEAIVSFQAIKVCKLFEARPLPGVVQRSFGVRE